MDNKDNARLYVVDGNTAVKGTQPFGDNAAKYIEAGYIVIPVNGKTPVYTGWPKTTLEESERLANAQVNARYGVGLLCGEPNGIVAVDLDYYEDYHQFLLNKLGASPVMKTGKKGVTLFYRFNGEISQQIQAGGQTLCDILSTGKQTVMPPSLHPVTNQPYYYQTADTLLDYKPEDLPLLPANYWDILTEVKTSIESAFFARNQGGCILTHSGRHDALLSQIRAGIDKKKDPETIAAEIYDYDLEKHNPPWLSDSSEQPFCGVPRTQPQRLARSWAIYEYGQVAKKDRQEIELKPPVAEFSKVELGKPKQASVTLNVECPGDWNDEDILNDDPTQTIIKAAEGVVLERGDLFAIIGKSKSHKSFMALQVALSVCAGKNLFNSFDCPNVGKVLILQTELKDSKFKRRILRMSEMLDIPRQSLNENLRVVNARGVIFKPEEITNDLIAQAKGFSLIVIDPIYLLLDGDENKTETIQKFVNWLRVIAEQTGAAVLIVHHDAKGQAGDRDIVDRGSGSGLLIRFMDTFMAVTKHIDWKKEDKLLVVESVARNTQEPADFTLRFTQGVLDAADKPALKQTSQTRKKKQGDLLSDTKLLEMLFNLLKAEKEKNPFGAYPKPKWAIDTLKAEAGISKDRATGILEQAKEDTERFIYIGGKGNPKTYITIVDNDGATELIEAKDTKPAIPEWLNDDDEDDRE